MTQDIMTIEEVATYLKASITTVYRMLKAKQVPAFKVRNQWRFKKEDLDLWVKNHTGAENGAAVFVAHAVVDWLVKTTSGEKGFKLIEYDVTNDSPLVNKTIGQARKQLKAQAKIIGVDTTEGFKKVPEDDLKIEAGNKMIMVINSSKFTL